MDPTGRPWLDSQGRTADRVAALVAAMTREEKVALAPGDEAAVAHLGIRRFYTDPGSGVRDGDRATAFPVRLYVSAPLAAEAPPAVLAGVRKVRLSRASTQVGFELPVDALAVYGACGRSPCCIRAVTGSPSALPRATSARARPSSSGPRRHPRRLKPGVRAPTTGASPRFACARVRSPHPRPFRGPAAHGGGDAGPRE